MPKCRNSCGRNARANPTSSLPPEAVPLDAVFDGRLKLRGYQVYQDAYTAEDSRMHPPSGWVHVTLYWEVTTPGVAFAPSLQVEDAIGQVWGIAFTRGSETLSRYPTVDWQPGQIWRSDADINLNPVTPPRITGATMVWDGVPVRSSATFIVATASSSAEPSQSSSIPLQVGSLAAGGPAMQLSTTAPSTQLVLPVEAQAPTPHVVGADT